MKSYLIYLLDFHSLFPQVFQKWIYLNKQILIVLLVVFDIKVYPIGYGYKWQICSSYNSLLSLLSLKYDPAAAKASWPRSFLSESPLAVYDREAISNQHSGSCHLEPRWVPRSPTEESQGCLFSHLHCGIAFSLCLWYWRCTCGCWGKRRDFWKNTYRYQSLAGHVTKCQPLL